MIDLRNKLERWLAPARNSAGLSLTETMIALALFAVGALPIAGSSVELGAMVTSAHIRTHAMAIAEQQVEEMLGQPYDQLVSGTASESGVDLEWTVTEALLSKRVVLTYRYNLRDRVLEDSLTAARLRP